MYKATFSHAVKRKSIGDNDKPAQLNFRQTGCTRTTKNIHHDTAVGSIVLTRPKLRLFYPTLTSGKLWEKEKNVESHLQLQHTEYTS